MRRSRRPSTPRSFSRSWFSSYRVLSRRSSEGLSQGQEELHRTDADDRAQQVADIKAQRPDRCLVAKAKAHAVRIFLRQKRQINPRIDIPPIVENRAAQAS